MTTTLTPTTPAGTQSSRNSALGIAARLFARVGALPVLLILALVVFSILSPNFLTADNLLSALRQNSYVAIAVLAQFVVLIAGGFALSVGSITALVSVTSAMAMANKAGDGAAHVRIHVSRRELAAAAAAELHRADQHPGGPHGGRGYLSQRRRAYSRQYLVHVAAAWFAAVLA